MNLSDIMKDLRGLGLKPYQAELVQDVVHAPLPARRLLVAAPGLGKTIAVMFTAREIIKAHPNYRILLIGPRVFAAMYKHQFGQAMPDENVTVVDRRKFREMESAVEKHQSIWPSPITVVIGMDTARQKDVLGHLCSVNWDLVVVEEVHLYGRSRWTLLRTILSNKTFQRVVLVTATPDVRSVTSLLKGVIRIEWVAAELKDWDGRQLFPPRAVKISTVVYRRSDEEVGLLQNLLQLTKELSPSPVGQMVKKVLLRQALSSPLALERTIRRLRNTLAHGNSEFILVPGKEVGADNFSEDLDTDADAAFPTAGQKTWQNKSRALTSLNHLIELTELLQSDKKREALEGLLDRLEQDALPKRPFICIFCSARATAGYLQTILGERGHKPWLLTGNQTPEELQASLNGFRSEGGILVCTSIALKGFDLRGVMTFIHYDPPASNLEMSVRVTRSPDATHYLLKDESDILLDEWTVPDLTLPTPKPNS